MERKTNIKNTEGDKMKKELLKVETLCDPKQTPAVINKKIDAMKAAQRRMDNHIIELTAMIEKKYDLTYTNVDTLIGDLLA